MEVIEHVADKPAFIAALAGAMKPEGLMILSTPNRTARSRLLLVEGAERIGMVPRGTHHWADFVTPDELRELLEGAGLKMGEPSGIAWSPGTVALALGAVAGGTALFLGILVLQGTLAFWTVESLEIANVLTHGGVQAAQYPLAVYAPWFRRLLTFAVPLACVAYYPALAILGRVDPLGAPAWLGWVSPLAGFAFLALAFQAWRLGLRRHASTGS